MIERWWMLRYPSGVVHMASTQEGAEAGHEAKAAGAKAFAVVRLADYEEVVDDPRLLETLARVIENRHGTLRGIGSTLREALSEYKRGR